MGRKKGLDTVAARAYCSRVQRMTPGELNALMEANNLHGQEGAEELARRVGTSWRSVYRWRAGDVAITKMASQSIRQALATPQERTSRIRPAARNSKKSNKK